MIVDACHVMLPVDLPTTVVSDTDYECHPDACWNYADVSPVANNVGRHTPRTWYKSGSDMHDLYAMKESAIYLKEVLETQGPFDVSLSCPE